MEGRPPVLQGFLDQLSETFVRTSVGPDINRCIDRVFTALARNCASGGNTPSRLPVCDYLTVAYDTARPKHAGLVNSFATLEPHLTWTKRAQSHSTASANFLDGHANALIIGPSGYEARDDVWLGVSLLAPHVRYPDHDHGPEEVYLALSDSKFQHGDDDWFTPGIGGQFHNTPNIRHAMASGDAPLFAIWCLPVGEGEPASRAKSQR
jgi:hypothetical protein